MPRSIKLGGLPLLATRDVTWATQPGVMPTIQEFECEPDIAAELIALGKSVSLDIMTDDGFTQSIKHLFRSGTA